MRTQSAADLTEFRKAELDNGLRVVTSAMPHARSVSISVFVGVGSRYEQADRAGVSHVVEHLLFKGTKRRPTPGEISGAVEGVGGEINAGTEQETTAYWCRVARPHLEVGLDLLIDMLRNSLFAEAEIERELTVVMEEQAMAKDFPSYRVDAMMDEMLWPDHALGREVSGTRESVAHMTREMIIDHASQFYTPSNVVVSVAGNIDHEVVVRELDSLSDGWTSRTPPRWAPFAHVQVAPQLHLGYRKTEQAHLSIGLPGLSLTHPDRYVLGLLSVVLGEGMSSRLFVEVREKQGLAYDIQSGVTLFHDSGALIIGAGVDPKRAYAAVETILAEVGRLRDGVSAEELEKAKGLSTGRLMLRMEETRAVSSWMGSQEMLLGKVLDVDEVIRLVESVTLEDMHRVSNDLLTTDKLNLAVVGPNRGERRFRGSLSL